MQTRLTFPIIFNILLAALLCAEPEQPPNSVAEIQSVLTAQQDAWNHHDLDAFMAGGMWLVKPTICSTTSAGSATPLARPTSTTSL